MNENPDRRERDRDHDLLVALNVKMEQVISDISELKDNTARRVSHLEDEKLDKAEALRLKSESDASHADFELRIRRLELWGALAIGGLAVIQFVFKFL